MSHSLKQTSFSTVGRKQNECKEGKVCSAVLSLHHTCKIELGHKDMTFWRKLELLSPKQWGDSALLVLTVVLLCHSDDWASFKHLNAALGLEQGALTPERVLLMQTILYVWTFSLQAAISVRVINTSPLSPEAMFGTQRELDQNSTLGCW